MPVHILFAVYTVYKTRYNFVSIWVLSLRGRPFDILGGGGGGAVLFLKKILSLVLQEKKNNLALKRVKK